MGIFDSVKRYVETADEHEVIEWRGKKIIVCKGHWCELEGREVEND